jgi:hypothetical protein
MLKQWVRQKQLHDLVTGSSLDQNGLAANRVARLATGRVILVKRLGEIEEELDKLFRKGWRN